MSSGWSALILGLGNRLMTDDAVGPLAIERLAARDLPDARLFDGGTMGLSILPEIENADALIAIDAARLGGAPGELRVLEGPEMDRALGGVKKSAHEVALADLMVAAAIQGAWPARRALIAIEPRTVSLGLEPSPEVAAALPEMITAVEALLARWRAEIRAGRAA